MLAGARSHLSKSGERELYLLQTDEAIQDFFQQRQAVLTEMNKEILAAVELVQAKYQQILDEMDQDYATYLTLITPPSRDMS